MIAVGTQVSVFGPFRAVGVTYTAGNGRNDFPGVWDRLMKKIEGTMRTEGASYFGICRCIPGAKDGTWEYVAAVEVPAEARVPEGMVEVRIPRAEYVVEEVAGLKEVGAAWEKVHKAVAESGREPYCGPSGRGCASHPAFEHYSPEFAKTGRLAIYVPVK